MVSLYHYSFYLFIYPPINNLCQKTIPSTKHGVYHIDPIYHHLPGLSRNLVAQMVPGVLMCCLSDIAAATTLVLAAAFSSTLKPPLSPLDTPLASVEDHPQLRKWVTMKMGPKFWDAQKNPKSIQK